MNILDKIIEHKKEEVKSQKAKVKIEELKSSQFFSGKTLSLREYLLDESKTDIIAEFKRKSPSKGIINDDADVVKSMPPLPVQYRGFHVCNGRYDRPARAPHGRR